MEHRDSESREIPHNLTEEELGLYSPRFLELRRRRTNEKTSLLKTRGKAFGAVLLAAAGMTAFHIAVERDNNHARLQTLEEMTLACELGMKALDSTPLSCDEIFNREPYLAASGESSNSLR